MSTTALAITGVKAVIEGLRDFDGGMKEMTGLVAGFGKQAAASAREFKPFQNIINAVTESLKRIAEFVIAGVILRGIEAITGALRDMIGSVVQAAMDFQGLQIRLENFVAVDLMKDGGIEDFATALEMAAPLTEELFVWVQKLALTTPFDTKSIADAMTMARAWGFNADEAKNLTRQVIDFTAGMGFGADEMDRVIKALGQMKSLGRVAGQELLQLANAGVPVSDIMEEIRLELGLTTDEFDKLRRKGGVSAEMFFEKWDELVKTRFEGSAQRMSHTLRGVISNFRDLTVEVVGLNVVKPVLDVIGDKLGNIFDTLTGGMRGDILINTLKIIGQDLAEIVGMFFGKLPSEENIADFILDKLLKLMQTIGGIREILQGDLPTRGKVTGILALIGFSPEAVGKLDNFIFNIKEFFKNFKAIITGEGVEDADETPVGKFFSKIRQSIENFKTFWEENKEGILGAFGNIAEALFGAGEITGESILEIAGQFIENMSQKLIENGPDIVATLNTIATFIRETMIPTLTDVADWFVENGPLILEIIVNLISFVKIAGKVLWLVFGQLILIIIKSITQFIDMVKVATTALIQLAIIIKTVISDALVTTITGFTQLSAIIANKVITVLEDLRDGLFRAGHDGIAGFVDGFITGLINAWNSIAPWISWFINQVRALFRESSPSLVFAEIGENLNKGLAKGIIDSIQLPAAAMDATVQHVVSAGSSAMMGSNTTNNTVNNSFNMNINSSARTEPIVQDFNTMQAIVGA
jgi:tape measure domain-containing protein